MGWYFGGAVVASFFGNDRRSTSGLPSRQPTRRTERHLMTRKARLAILATAFAVLALAAPVAAAGPFGGATTWTSAATTYRADPAKGRINVSITLKIRNDTPDGIDQYPCIQYTYDPYWGNLPYSTTCTRSIRYYLTQTQLLVESQATGLKATSTAGKVTLKAESSLSSLPPSEFKVYTATFPRIYEGQSRTIQITYALRAGDARSGSQVRMNGAYLSFGGFAQPVDDASVRFVVPSAFDTVTFGNDVSESHSASTRTYASGPVSDPSKYYVMVEGTNLAGFHRETIEAPDHRQIQLEAWPGDEQWLTAVMSEAAASITTLEGLIGTSLPGSGPITVREVAGGSLGDAYAGIYDPDEDLAQIPEDYQQAGTVAHELSHAWFNGSVFAAQWLSEGYAGWAERAIGANPVACSLPRVSFGGRPADLSEWKSAGPRATQVEFDVIRSEYETSCGLISEVAGQIGPDGMRNVLSVLLSSEGAYPGTRDVSTGAANDWRAWLDAVDERGMTPARQDSTHGIADLLVTYGVATEGDLAGRTSARQALDDLRGMAGRAWTIPQAVYAPLATWDFTTANRAMTEMSAVIDDGEALRQILSLSPADGTLPARVAAATSLGDLTTARQSADRQVAVAQDVAAAIDRASADHGPLDSLGMIGADLTPLTDAAMQDVAGMNLDQAQADIAALDATLAEATSTGVLRLGLIMGLVSLVVAVIWLIRRRRRPTAILGVPTEEADE